MEFSCSHFNGAGSYFPGSTYNADEMLNVSNFSGVNRRGREIWVEVAAFLDKNGIPLATLSCPLYDDPILFLVEKERDRILSQIRSDLEQLLDWE